MPIVISSKQKILQVSQYVANIVPIVSGGVDQSMVIFREAFCALERFQRSSPIPRMQIAPEHLVECLGCALFNRIPACLENLIIGSRSTNRGKPLGNRGLVVDERSR